jgi:hypothetical protein
MNVMIDTVHNAIRQIKRGGGWGGGRVGRRSRAKEGKVEQSKGVEQNSG